jgi:hypothetical protein
MIRKLKRAMSFSLLDWSIFIQSWAMLLIIDIWLRTNTYKGLRDFLIRQQYKNSGKFKIKDNMTEAEIKHIGSIVETASRNHIVQMSCLRRALVQQWFLNTRGVNTELRFGVRTVDGKLLAHAWLEKDGKLISEPEIIRDQFATLLEVINKP